VRAQARLARLARLVPAGGSTAARTPFVLLVVVLLVSGLIALLLLNASLNKGSFRLSELQQRTKELTDEQQALQQQVDAYSDPEELAGRARELGMVPGGPPAFLGRDGTVHGSPSPAPTPSTTPGDGAVSDAGLRPGGAASPGPSPDASAHPEQEER
jgi:type II secretory pathway pseudopilin PulG